MNIINEDIKFDNFISENFIGSVTRWVKDGDKNNFRGHFEQSLSSNVKPGMVAFIDYKPYWILDIIGDGTEPYSVLLDSFCYTGRVREIFSIYVDENSNLNYGKGSFNNINIYDDKLIESFSSKFTGNGILGDVIISNSQVINKYVSVISYNQNTITVQNSLNFNIGDEVLLLQSQNGLNSSKIGQYETFYIIDKIGNILYLDHDILYEYGLGSVNSRPSYNCQLISIPNYNNLTITSTGSITPSNWDGSIGGVLIFRVKNKLINYGNINAKGKGFRGLWHYYNGEGYYGWVVSGGGSYGGGGGVGSYHYSKNENLTTHKSGGGGGGGLTSSDDAIRRIGMGCGGGSSGYINFDTRWARYYNGASGGNGGGIIFISAYVIENYGTITVAGNNGNNGNYYTSKTYQDGTFNHYHYVGGGGAGSGGSIIINCLNLNNNGIIDCNGGSGGVISGGYSGGNGTDGIIRINYGKREGSSPINYNRYRAYELKVKTVEHTRYFVRRKV